jgi:hypothetical protein
MKSAPTEITPYPELLDRVDLATLSEVNRAELRRLSHEIFRHYRGSDRAAVRGQRRHEIVVVLVGVFGTLAILVALAELARVPIPASAEIIAVGIAAAGVALGLFAALQHSWLLRRHQAERYQLLMWGLLIDPHLWSPSAAAAAAVLTKVEANLRRLQRLSYKNVEAWLDGDERLSEIDERAGPSPPSLTSLYCEVRLRGQARYFSDRSRSHRRLDRWTRRIPLSAFILSVAAALGHFARDVVIRDSEVGVGLWLLCAAAGIPILAGAVRIIRAALEPARNSSRYHGKHKLIEGLIRRIQHEDRGTGALFRDYLHGEQLLEAEHREWLRLMVESEWIG